MPNRSGNDQTLPKYKDEAKKADVKTPDNVNGGVVHDKPSTSTSPTSTSAGGATATAKSAAYGINAAGASSATLFMAVAGVLMIL